MKIDDDILDFYRGEIIDVHNHLFTHEILDTMVKELTNLRFVSFDHRYQITSTKMYQEEKVSLTIAIPKNYRDRLRTMAAQQNLHDPDQITSASTIAREIICEYIDKVDRLEDEFEKANLADTSIETAYIELPEATTEKLERKRDE